MEETTTPLAGSSLRFAEAARCLSDAARPLGLAAPSFRSPPRIAADRSLRRRADGTATVAVRYRDRPWPAVLADLVEGVVVANDIPADRAASVRAALWRSLEAASLTGEGAGSAGGGEPTATVRPLARVA
jgi:hypothetical protein